ncbi:MAG: clostripain-related cysteine peptidase, partial [Polyangiaceae bacterium]|nr:clostripain-related cysteine peptidase [Polyangiaceae bacterium]
MARASLGATLGLAMGCTSYEGEQWTYLVYMHADNNLDPAAADDLAEMLKVKGDGATFVVQVDRNPDYGKRTAKGLPFEAGAQRILIHDGEAEILEDLGEVNSSDPEVLQNFIEWGLADHDNERLAFFFWNHGGGWIGFGHDETDDAGILGLEPIEVAMTDALQNSPREKFDLLGFDACLMGNLEVAHSFVGLADYYLGSQENEPGHGWNYESMELRGDADGSPEGVGRAILAGFEEQAKDRGTSANITLSLIDLEKVDAVNEALTAGFSAVAGADITVDFFEMFAEDAQQELVKNIAELAAARSESVVFGAESTQLVDIHELWQTAADKDPELQDAADGITAAIDAAVLERVQGKFHAGARGLSFFFPAKESQLPLSYAATEDAGLA